MHPQDTSVSWHPFPFRLSCCWVQDLSENIKKISHLACMICLKVHLNLGDLFPSRITSRTWNTGSFQERWCFISIVKVLLLALLNCSIWLIICGNNVGLFAVLPLSCIASNSLIVLYIVVGFQFICINQV